MAAFGRGISRTPLSQSRSASQWMAAMIFITVTTGSAKNERSNANVFKGAASAIEGCSEQRAIAVGFQDTQFDAISRRKNPENDSASPFRQRARRRTAFMFLSDARVMTSPK